MKVTIFDDVPRKKIIRLMLVEENGVVYVVAVDKYGKVISYLLSITQEGITRCGMVDEKVGFPLLSGDMRIKMAEPEQPEVLPLRSQIVNVLSLLNSSLKRENKITIIKIVRHLTSMGLKEAKEYVEKEFDM